MINVIRLALTVLIIAQSGLVAAIAGTADESAIRNAWNLYTMQKYVPSADAFEALIRTSAPSSRLYCYAAAANKAAGRLSRAKQLCQYISTNFSTSAEAGYVQQLFPSDTAKSTSSAPAGLPEHLKGKSIDELMQSEEGRQALKEALGKGGAASPKVTSGSSSSSVPTTSSRAASKSGSSITIPSDAAFSPEIIAAEGADGITQFVRYPDAGFECSLAALALLPRGRELIASMIRCPSAQDIYFVRFPNGPEFQITPAKMEQYRMKDKALWATLIHGAVRESTAGHLEEGLSLLTGHHAEKILANNTTEQAVATFIREAVKKGHPVVCLSSDDGNTPELVELFAGYTITGYDPATGMITMRNPHGANSRRFRLETDPEHKKFEQLNGGNFKMHVSLFRTYFKELARSAI